MNKLVLATACAASLCSVSTLAQNINPGRNDQSFEELEMIFEINNDDQDGEVVIYGKGEEGLRWVRVIGPKGNRSSKTVGFGTSGSETIGMAQFLFESAEPSIDEVVARYPDGTYTVVGRTISGNRIFGTVEFNKELAAPPIIDTCDQVVDPVSAVISWTAADDDVESIILEVENDDLEVGLEMRISGDASEIDLPMGFLTSGTEYDLGVAFVNEQGNVIVSECSFETSD